MWRYVKFVCQVSGSDHYGNLTHKGYWSSNNSSAHAGKKAASRAVMTRKKAPEIDLKPT